MSTPDYSVIIPAFNEEHFISATLESVNKAMKANPSLKGELIVTDNNSTDRTAEVAREHGAKVVFEEMQQIARSRNAGAAQAKGHYLIFVDADTLITGSLLKTTLDTLDTGDYCGGGTLASFDKECGWLLRRFLALWTFLSKTFKWAAGSYVFCLKEGFVDIGGFNEEFYASEEVHLSIALKRWGKKRQLKMKILDEPVVTSTRKVDWYSTRRLLGQFLIFFVMPWRLKSREGCSLWYDRPEEDGKLEGHEKEK